MAEASSRALFTGAEVLDLYAVDSDDKELRDDGVDEVFFLAVMTSLVLRRKKLKMNLG